MHPLVLTVLNLVVFAIESCRSFLNIRTTLGIAGLDVRFKVVESTRHVVHFYIMSALNLKQHILWMGWKSILFSMSSLDIVLNLVLSWFSRSSTTWTRSEGCVSGAGYGRRSQPLLL